MYGYFMQRAATTKTAHFMQRAVTTKTAHFMQRAATTKTAHFPVLHYNRHSAPQLTSHGMLPSWYPNRNFSQYNLLATLNVFT
jgi:hypothetical protein